MRRNNDTSPSRRSPAYDYPTARLIDEAGIDLILVGDSVAMTVLGYDSTLPLTMDEMMHHAKAVRRAVRRALLVVDMPYGSYHVSDEEAVRNAIPLRPGRRCRGGQAGRRSEPRCPR